MLEASSLALESAKIALKKAITSFVIINFVITSCNVTNCVHTLAQQNSEDPLPEVSIGQIKAKAGKKRYVSRQTLWCQWCLFLNDSFLPVASPVQAAGRRGDAAADGLALRIAGANEAQTDQFLLIHKIVETTTAAFVGVTVLNRAD